MSVKKLTRPVSKQQLVTGTLGAPDAATQSRMLSELATAHEDLTRNVPERSSMTVNLAVGANIMNHGLGGKPRGASVSPTVADVTFAWAMTAADDKQATITVLNIAQPNAGIEYWR
jgi:hypothetical protein